MKQAAVGFRVHSGWTALVAVSLARGEPRALARERVHLVDTFTYEFRQPYHTAERMAADEAGAFVSRVESEAKSLATEALRHLRESLGRESYELTRCGLLMASGRALPSLDKILASHALIHTADGELFRKALLDASKGCGLAVMTVKERELMAMASRTLRTKPEAIARRLTELGKPFGAPWSQDEKFATLAAWLGLSKRKDS